MEELETPTKLSVLMTELDIMQEEDKDSFEIMLSFINELANR